MYSKISSLYSATMVVSQKSSSSEKASLTSCSTRSLSSSSPFSLASAIQSSSSSNSPVMILTLDPTPSSESASSSSYLSPCARLREPKSALISAFESTMTASAFVGSGPYICAPTQSLPCASWIPSPRPGPEWASRGSAGASARRLVDDDLTPTRVTVIRGLTSAAAADTLVILRRESPVPVEEGGCWAC
jgi:hypothetical protein